MSNTATLESLLKIFNIEAKSDLEKYCRQLAVQKNDFFILIQAGLAGLLDPYKYACHFHQKIPEHLHATDEERRAFSENGVGPLRDKARKFTSIMLQVFEERRCFAAHLFYTPSHTYWYLFYFDQQDQNADKNHWPRGGPHIHLISSHWPNLKLEEVWQDVQEGKTNFSNKIHLRYLSDVEASDNE